MAENGDPEQIAGSALSGNAFELLELRVALGRGFTSEDAAAAGRILILSDDLWRRRFGADSAIVGRTIELSGSRREVVGVMPPGVRVPTYEGSQLWTPRDFSNILANPTARHVRNFRLVARLEPGVTRAAAQANVDRAMRSLQTELPQAYGGIDARLVPIRTAVAGDAKSRLLLLMGAAAFVLLIACANVSGILLSRAIARGHELSVRVALGAGRRRLARQFLVEGVVLAVCGVAFGLLVAQFGIGVLRQIATTALPVGTVFALEPRVLVFAVAVATAAALACSLVPAIAATRVRGVALRRDDGKASLSRANRRLRLGLVAGQLAVSVVLLVGAGLLLRTLHRLSSLDVGYATDHALTFRLPFTRPKSDAEQDAFYASLYQQLRAIPGVTSVAGGNMPMSGQHTVVGLEIEGRLVETGRLTIRFCRCCLVRVRICRRPVSTGRPSISSPATVLWPLVGHLAAADRHHARDRAQLLVQRCIERVLLSVRLRPGEWQPEGQRVFGGVAEIQRDTVQRTQQESGADEEHDGDGELPGDQTESQPPVRAR